MAAAFLKIDELQLDPSEAKDLAAGIQEVGKHYAMTFDPKTVAIANLVIISGGIYGTRVMAYNTRMASERGGKGPKIVEIKAEPAQSNKTNGHAAGGNMSPSDLWPEPAVD
jgi:hypothetical protein